jgi:periplasmic divalent cation tolerance protein|tara:strand:- start:1406 stop:1711 length:306 start_codon:yes stop_codon:yes gene_type:complete
MIIIQTTLDEEKKVKNLINLLLETNKIACGTFHKIESSYRWKEEVVEDYEFEVSLYTKDSLMREVVDIVKQRHSYELPKITVLEPVFTLPEYENWVSDSTS